jgi:hypothetical protein
MSKVQMIDVDTRAIKSHFHDMTCKSIVLASGSELLHTYNCFLMLTCIEDHDSLKTMMKTGMRQKIFTCLDQEKKHNNIWILVRKRECEIKSFVRIPDVPYPTEGDALGDTACQGGLNADRLHHDES